MTTLSERLAEHDGRCENCGEDEMDGSRCYYCGWHDYNCEMPDCQWCAGRLIVKD